MLSRLLRGFSERNIPPPRPNNPMAKRKPIDPDRKRASKHTSWTRPINVDGELEGHVTVWDYVEDEKHEPVIPCDFLDDEGHKALVICEYLDGEIGLYLEKEGE